MSYLSRSLVYNGQPVDDRSTVAQYIRQSRPDILIEEPTPSITGDTATIVSPVDVTMNVGLMPVHFRLERVEVTLGKETGTRYFVLPAPRWRIRSIKSEAVDVAQWMN